MYLFIHGVVCVFVLEDEWRGTKRKQRNSECKMQESQEGDERKSEKETVTEGEIETETGVEREGEKIGRASCRERV